MRGRSHAEEDCDRHKLDSIGMLTFFVLIPAGVVLGSVFGAGFGMRQANEE